jgi:hypothetical protein
MVRRALSAGPTPPATVDAFDGLTLPR